MDHSIFRGDTALFRLEVKDRLKGAVNVEGWSFVLSCARQVGGTVIFDVDGVISDAAAGVVTFELTPAQTAEVGLFFYDVQGTTPGGQIYTVDSGRINITQDITP